MDKTNLVEIKNGQTGTGLLIERDGYLTIEPEKREKIMESMSDGGFSVPNPFIVDAVFQKFGIKNANGRIYPEEILKKQVQEYQTRIAEHRAYGECYRPSALILTEVGWKKLEDVEEGENILTLNTETNEIEVKPILRKIERNHDGFLFNVSGDKINDFVTPGHMYPIYDINACSFKGFYTVSSFYDGKLKNTEKLGIPYKEHVQCESDQFILLSSLNVNEVPYNGPVMCVEVENHTWYVMENGFCHWTKNCNHPSETTIDLGRISHNIIELHWEGRTLVGKMELNISEGFRRCGICSTYGDTVANLLLNGYKIGVSSRGVGSVEQKLGNLVVGDDFELICFDIVSDPSTPNAWLANGHEKLQSYIETEDKTNGGKLKKIDEKLEKIKNILEN